MGPELAARLADHAFMASLTHVANLPERQLQQKGQTRVHLTERDKCFAFSWSPAFLGQRLAASLPRVSGPLRE